MIDVRNTVEQAKEIIKRELISEREKRMILLYALYVSTGAFVGEFLTCKINDYTRFEDNYNKAKSFFLSFN